MGEKASGVFKNTKGKIANSRYEAISVGVLLALRIEPSLRDKAKLNFMTDSEFGELVRGDGSNNPGRLKSRIEYVRDKLLGEMASDNNKKSI
jgi:hypothetical protein